MLPVKREKEHCWKDRIKGTMLERENVDKHGNKKTTEGESFGGQISGQKVLKEKNVAGENKIDGTTKIKK